MGVSMIRAGGPYKYLACYYKGICLPGKVKVHPHSNELSCGGDRFKENIFNCYIICNLLTLYCYVVCNIQYKCYINEFY